MAVDKLVDSTQLDTDLTAVADAIRTKGGTSAQMAFPAGFVSAVQNIQTGITPTGTKQISISQNGTTTEDVAAYANAEITVDVQGGGGVALEKGSFIATTSDSLTIPVTALHSHIYIYHSTINAATDLTGNPYGAYKKLVIYADNNNGFIMQGATNYAGTAIGGEMGKIGGWPNSPRDANSIVFTDSQIKFTKMRYNGAAHTFIDGDTYYWEAW